MGPNHILGNKVLVGIGLFWGFFDVLAIEPRALHTPDKQLHQLSYISLVP